MKRVIVGVKHLVEGIFSLRLFSTIKNWWAFSLGLLGVSVLRRVVLRSGSRTIEIETRSQSDLFVAHEVFIRNDYGIDSLITSNDCVVVDAGANIGVFTVAAALAGAAKVIAFEPEPDNFRLLQKNVSRNRLSNVICDPRAVWHSVTKLGFRRNETNPGGHQVVSGVEAAMTVSTESLAGAIEQFEFAQTIVLKMDIEGAEYDVIYNTPEQAFQRLSRIRIEYHDLPNRNSGCTGEALAGFLCEQGYSVTKKPHFGTSHGYLFCSRI